MDIFLPVENDIIYVGKWHIPKLAKEKPEGLLLVFRRPWLSSQFLPRFAQNGNTAI
tara:strand:- start:86 stop:253 length:168 start_codon:yes stop_codon:yes gene_type:complete